MQAAIERCCAAKPQLGNLQEEATCVMFLQGAFLPRRYIGNSTGNADKE